MMLKKLNNELVDFLENVEIISSSNNETLSISYENVNAYVHVDNDMYNIFICTNEKDNELHLTKILVEKELSDDEEEVRLFIYEANTLAKAYKIMRNHKDFKLESISHYNMTFTLKNLKVEAYVCYEELDVTITRLDTNEILLEDDVCYHEILEEVLYECLEKTM